MEYCAKESHVFIFSFLFVPPTADCSAESSEGASRKRKREPVSAKVPSLVGRSASVSE